MIAETSEPQTGYPIEVSRWDEHEDFFVERTELYWSEQSRKHILILRPIVSGALVFLRLIDPLSIDRVRPVPYRAELFETIKGGQCRVRVRRRTLVTRWGARQAEAGGLPEWEEFRGAVLNRNQRRIL